MKKVIFSKEEIKEIMKNIKPLKYNDHKKEKFKQVIIDDEYIPYIISSYGRLFSIYFKGSNKINLKQMQTTYSKKGYERINISYNNSSYQLQIHPLVASAFVENENPDKYIMVNHIDGIKSHNFYWNLEWCTAKHNVQHAEKNKLRQHAKGEKHGRNIHSEQTIRKVCDLISSNKYTFKEISNKTGVSSKLIYRIYKGKVWKDVVKDYNFDTFDKYTPINEEEKNERKRIINIVCLLLESNEYTMKEISEITGLNIKMISSVLHGYKHKDVSKNYDLTKFTNKK